MRRYVNKHRVAVVGIVFLILTALILIAPDRGGGVLSEARRVLLTISSPVQRLLVSVYQDVVGVWDGYIYLVGVEEENEQLRSSLEKISSKYENLKVLYVETEKKNQRLENILDFTHEVPYDLIPARVIGRDAQSFSSSIVVDKGTTSGVSVDMPVISTDGVVGIVISASTRSSRIVLLNDKNCRIDVIVQDDRTRGILEGAVDGSLKLSYVDRKIEITEGDIIVTSGMGGTFPKGLVVGEVAEVAVPPYGLFQEIVVDPRAKLSALEEVFIIIR